MLNTLSEHQDATQSESDKPDLLEQQTRESEKTVSDLLSEPQKPTKKQVAAEKARNKNIEVWAERLANEEVTIEETPEWVRESAEKRKEEIIAEATKSESEIDILKKEIEQMKSQTEQQKRQAQREEAKKIMDTFLKNNGLTPTQFHEEYWDDFYSRRSTLIEKGIPEDEATDLSLSKIVVRHNEKQREEQEKSAGFTGIPAGRKPKPKGTMTARQEELAKKFGNDPSKVYG